MLNYSNDGHINEYKKEKLNYLKKQKGKGENKEKEEEYEKSDDSDKHIMVVNRKIKSQIFFEPHNKKNIKDMNNKMIIKKKKTNICHEPIGDFKHNKSKQIGNMLTKNTSNPSNFKNAEKVLQKSSTSLIVKQNKIMNKSGINDNIKMEENIRNKNNLQNNVEAHDKQENDTIGKKTDESDKCMDLHFSSEIMNSTCANYCILETNAIADAHSDKIKYRDPNDMTEGKIIGDKDDNSHYNKEINKIQNHNRAKQIDNSNDFCSYEIASQHVLQECKKTRREICEEVCEEVYDKEHEEWYAYTNVIKQHNHYHYDYIDEKVEEKRFHMNNNYIYKKNKNNYVDREKEYTFINKTNENTDSVIKYEEFELDEINKELEQIVEEENRIQEKLIYLSNKEKIKAIQITGNHMKKKKKNFSF
ncbi:conserved Plasmodium protein, unknown function [Plasmodium malariae]|uniref:Uncharacterized protein n=1 Tax=Plasmodium malariae TaxID=5858 RepID=A0A1C3KCG9_PLAMA|nr:conserved Plasmodium protein, unknown function [Plasmodium malariae]